MDHYTLFSLSEHVHGCARNSIAALDENPLLLGLVSEVHGYYGDALNLVSTISRGGGEFLGMSHGAFLASVQIALTGQLPLSSDLNCNS